MSAAIYRRPMAERIAAVDRLAGRRVVAVIHGGRFADCAREYRGTVVGAADAGGGRWVLVLRSGAELLALSLAELATIYPAGLERPAGAA